MIGAVLVLTGAAPKRMPPVRAAELSLGTTTVEGKALGGVHAVVRVRVGTTPRPWPHGAAIVWGEFNGPPQRDSEFPDDVWEETRYHWIDPASTR